MILETVHHYTTLEALVSIFSALDKEQGEDRMLTFWASSVFSMNDTSEFRYGFQYFKQKILEYEDIHQVPLNSRISTLWKNTKRHVFDERLTEAIADSQHCPFAISFSKKKDNLMMWQQYSSTKSGLCLTFRQFSYEPLFNHETLKDLQFAEGIRADDISYGKLEDDMTVWNVFLKKYDKIRRKGKTTNTELWQLFVLFSLLTATLVKHPAYAEEEEVRLVKLSDKNHPIKFRVAKGRLRPYIEVPVPLKELESVTVAPGQNQDDLQKDVVYLLRHYGVTVPVNTSEIPYRD